MSIRCSGCARRSFIMGSRLWPPAMMRASDPSRWRDAIAHSTLVARSYSNGAGVCKSAPLLAGGHPLASAPDLFVGVVLHGRIRPDHGGARQQLGLLMAY